MPSRGGLQNVDPSPGLGGRSLRYKLVGGPVAGIIWAAGETLHDLYYEPGPWEQMPDGTRQRTCLTELPTPPTTRGRESVSRYVFDAATRSYVWRGAVPRREVHRG
ncbi:MAG TPA: hypothetical protein VGN72_15300 [Tepidisphaeraceae bacterium]|nr:hypothetical protein [Tepidisphaeraceae bacterium]